jgi:hypothetical protein
VAGQRDLRAGAHADAAAVVQRHGAEEDDVADEGERLQHEREGQPRGVAVREPLPDVRQVRELRGEHERADHQHGRRADQHGDAARGQGAQGGGPIDALHAGCSHTCSLVRNSFGF